MSTDINETRTDQDPEHEQSEHEQSEQGWPGYEAAARQEPTSENTESEGYESERAESAEGEQSVESAEGTEPPESPEYGEAATGGDEFPAFGEPVSATTDEQAYEGTELPENTDPAEDYASLNDSAVVDDSENLENSPATEGGVLEPEAEDVALEADEPATEGAPLPENLGGRNLDAEREPLVDAAAQQEFLSRWTRIQISFLEDPTAAVESADVLVQEIGAAIASTLEARGGELAAAGRAATDTEQQRLALRQYRAYLGALLPQ